MRKRGPVRSTLDGLCNGNTPGEESGAGRSRLSLSTCDRSSRARASGCVPEGAGSCPVDHPRLSLVGVACRTCRHQRRWLKPALRRGCRHWSTAWTQNPGAAGSNPAFRTQERLKPSLTGKADVRFESVSSGCSREDWGAASPSLRLPVKHRMEVRSHGTR